LLGAVKRGSLDDVQAILSEGINPRRAGFKEALAQAGQSGNIEILRCFVEAGADVNARFENGSRLLHCAIVSGCATAVKYLVDRGADVGAKNEVLGEPPLFTAMFCGDNAEIAEVLLNGGVEVNRAVDVRFSSSGPLEGGVTPLMCAARFVCPSVVESLLKHGASRTARDASGKVALAYAAEKIGFFERLQKRPDVKNPDWVKAQLDKLTRIVEMISSSRGAH
jgi:ankyrin repeat protein